MEHTQAILVFSKRIVLYQTILIVVTSLSIFKSNLVTTQQHKEQIQVKVGSSIKLLETFQIMLFVHPNRILLNNIRGDALSFSVS